jgi:hypothetical protein
MSSNLLARRSVKTTNLRIKTIVFSATSSLPSPVHRRTTETVGKTKRLKTNISKRVHQ